MTWRDHTWEFTVTAFSWLVALGAVVFVIAFVLYDSAKTRKSRR